MSNTEFLSTLRPPHECPAKANRVAERFMQTKGYGDKTPLGVYIDGDLLYYYYRLPEGVLEVELTPREGRWHRRVSDFITNREDIQEMLGDDEPANEPPRNAGSAGTAIFQSGTA